MVGMSLHNIEPSTLIIKDQINADIIRPPICSSTGKGYRCVIDVAEFESPMPKLNKKNKKKTNC